MVISKPGTSTPTTPNNCVPCMPYVPTTPSGPPPIPVQTTIKGIDLNINIIDTEPFDNLNGGISTTTLPPVTTTLPPVTTTLPPVSPIPTIICDIGCNKLKF